MDRSVFQGTVRIADQREDISSCTICCLGADQILGILQKLPVRSILAFGMTCSRFRGLADSDALWALVCRREWGNRAVDAWLGLGRNIKIGWKGLHRQMLALGSITWHRLYQGDFAPPARASHSLVSFSDKVTIFGGGYDGGGYSGDNCSLFICCHNSAWYCSHSFKKFRRPHAAASDICMGRVCLLGGQECGRHLDDTWVAPLPEDLLKGIEWQQTSIGIPGGRFAHSCMLVGSTLVLFGGINDHGTRQNDTWINTGICAPNMQGQNFWQIFEVAAAPSPRGAHAGCYAGDMKVVVYGGIQSDGIRLDDTWSLDLSEKPLPAWRKVITHCSPPARSGHTLTWVGGKHIILFGGRGTKFEVMNDVWLLDMEEESPQWVELRPGELYPMRSSPAPRAGHSATLIFGGRILIYGGEDARRCRKGDVWVLDPTAGIPVGSSSSTSVMKNEAGNNRLGRKFWKKLKQWGERPSRRSFHAACAVHAGCGALVFGGMVDGELTPAAAGGLGFDAELFLLQLLP